MIISERIFYIMEQKNMSQLELSRRTGIATSNISDWKKKKTNPKADCLLSICDALDITPEQLLTGKGIDPEYKDADMDYEVTRSDIKILKQILPPYSFFHSHAFSRKPSLPRSCLSMPCFFRVSMILTSVAILAWSVPGCHSAL